MRLVGCHCAVALFEVLVDNVRACKVIQKSAYPPPSNYPVQSFIDILIDSDRQLLEHIRIIVVYGPFLKLRDVSRPR